MLDTTCDSCGTAPAEWFVRAVESGRESALCQVCLSRESTRPLHPLEAIRKHLAQMAPAHRARAAASLTLELPSELAAIRAAAIRELRSELDTWAAVGRAVGVSTARAANIAAGNDRARRENVSRERRIRRVLDVAASAGAGSDRLPTNPDENDVP